MSLNGLDSDAVVQAQQAALTAAGGWFLLQYANRDTVELLDKGVEGVSEARRAIESYMDKSPVYGLVQYRRKKIILKYVPEGTSRLLQVRLAVHFQSILDTFSAHDTVFSFTTADELTESALGLNAMLQSTSSKPSSTSSLRQQRLNQIAEDNEEGPTHDVASPTETPTPSPDEEAGGPPATAATAKVLLAKHQQHASEHLSVPLAEKAQISDPVVQETLRAEARTPTPEIPPPPAPPSEQSPSRVTSASVAKELPTHPQTDLAPLVDFPTNVNIPRPSIDFSLPPLDSDSDDDVRRPVPKDYAPVRYSNHLSAAESSSISRWTEDVVASTRSKQKRGPRESQIRPRTSGHADDSATPRRVANLPTSVRYSKRISTQASRPGSQQSSRSVPVRWVPSQNLPPPLPSPTFPVTLQRPPDPRAPPSQVSSLATENPSVTPEKMRLMKALQMRKRNQLLAQRSASAAAAASNPLGSMDSSLSGASDLESAQQPSNAIAEEATIKPAELTNVDESETTTSPISSLTVSDSQSTKPSSLSESSLVHRSTSSISSDTNSSTTPKADPEKSRQRVPTSAPASTLEGLAPEPAVSSAHLAPEPLDATAECLAPESPISAAEGLAPEPAVSSIHLTPEPAASTAERLAPELAASMAERPAPEPTVSMSKDLVPEPTVSMSEDLAPEPSVSTPENVAPEPPASTSEDLSREPPASLPEKGSSTINQPVSPVSNVGRVDRARRESRGRSISPVSSTAPTTKEPAIKAAKRRHHFEGKIVIPPSNADVSDILDDDELMDELQNATVHQARPVAVSRTPVTPALSQPPSRDAREFSSGSATRSQPRSASIESRTSTQRATSRAGSVRSLSTALPQWPPMPTEPIPALPKQKPTIGTNISKRIKAFEGLSQRDTKSVPISGGQQPPEKASPKTLASPLRAEFDAPENQSAPRPLVQRPGTGTEVYTPTHKGETVSITARIVRDPTKPKSAHGTSDTRHMHRSPLIVEHETPDPLNPRPPLPHELIAPPIGSLTTSPMSDRRRFSFSSHRSHSKPLSPTEPKSHRISFTGHSRKSQVPSSETSSITDEKRASRTSRILKRLSGLGKVRNRESVAWPAQESLHEEPAAEQAADSPAKVRQMVDIGEVNVQFADSMLWKRRFLRVDDQGYLIFAPPANDFGARGKSRKIHLDELQRPALPDREREEMAWSILLDLKDGGTVQCACESKSAQSSVFNLLIDAHSAYHQLYDC